MSKQLTTGSIPTGAFMNGASSQDCVLTPSEMVALNARLARRTAGRVAVGPDPITRRQARASWRATQAFAAEHAKPSEAGSTRGRRSRQRQPDALVSSPARGLAALILSAAAVSGCATLGGNVKGGFSCRAPDGVCAPTSKIDDQALAMISGGDGDPMPAGIVDPASRDDPRFTPISATSGLTRTSEKVLRIVFPAHVDRQGRYREASAIHAVVERAAWTQAALGSFGPVIGRREGSEPQLAGADQGPSLAELASASPEVAFPPSAPDVAVAAEIAPAAAPPDSNAPSAASVQAARRKGAANRATRAAEFGPRLPVPPALVPASVSATALATSTSAKTVSSFDLRKLGKASPLQAIREKVGSIFAAHAAAKPFGTAATVPTSTEHPVNGPAVLAVSGVDK